MHIFFILPVDGIPTAYYFGQEGLHNVLVIDLLGPSLEDMFDICGRRFSTKTVAMLAKQMVPRLSSSLASHYIHPSYFFKIPSSRAFRPSMKRT